ncbi:MAG: type II secretion system protein [Sedimentisphaerales bacterium]|nr:type II secretion system protein [Sedimentisphaerales bacterium]
MNTKKKRFGFTITELLTVMSIIALLLGILTPALNMVRRIAKDTRQRAQFHSISVALEAYAGDFEQYPDSTTNPGTLGAEGIPDPGATYYTTGAHHLAEALLGRDFLGLDPWTHWDADYDEITVPDNSRIYASEVYGHDIDDVEASLDRRMGPYLESETVEAYQLAQLYGNAANVGNVYPGNLDAMGGTIASRRPAPVLTDSYRVTTVMLPNQQQAKAGSPILYYKANTLSRKFYNTSPESPDTGDGVNPNEAAESIYNSQDNEELIKLGVVTNQNEYHHFDPDPLHYTYKGAFSGRELFYDEITDSKITTQVRPFNQKSYILVSAGFDSVFGTPDDIYNFRN